MHIDFKGGINIALKIPEDRYQATLAFYQDILLLDVERLDISHPQVLESHRVAFGPNILWLDCVKGIERSEVWMEIQTSDVRQATAYLQTNGIGTCDEIEEIPSDMHWIKDPAGTTFILKNG